MSRAFLLSALLVPALALFGLTPVAHAGDTGTPSGWEDGDASGDDPNGAPDTGSPPGEACPDNRGDEGDDDSCPAEPIDDLPLPPDKGGE